MRYFSDKLIYLLQVLLISYKLTATYISYIRVNCFHLIHKLIQSTKSCMSYLQLNKHSAILVGITSMRLLTLNNCNYRSSGFGVVSHFRWHVTYRIQFPTTSKTKINVYIQTEIQQTHVRERILPNSFNGLSQKCRRKLPSKSLAKIVHM